MWMWEYPRHYALGKGKHAVGSDVCMSIVSLCIIIGSMYVDDRDRAFCF